MDSIRPSSQRIPRPAHRPMLDFAQLRWLKASDLSPENGSFKINEKIQEVVQLFHRISELERGKLEWGHMVQKGFFLNSPSL